MIADSVNSVLADIEFKLSNYKLKVVNAIIKTRDSKKHSDIDSIFHDISRNKASNIRKDAVQIPMSKLVDLNVIIVNKTKQGQEPLFPTKDTTAIPTKDNTVFISSNDESQDTILDSRNINHN